MSSAGQDRDQVPDAARFFAACAAGDEDVLRRLLDTNPGLARATDPSAAHAGWTGLHTAARGGHAEAVRVLLGHGADPDAREAGDHTTPLHWAAAGAHLDAVHALLDAGADVHGEGDAHALDVIGWATFYQGPGEERGTLAPARGEVVGLLVARGARHHVFSALCAGDARLLRDVVARDPRALERRLSRFDRGLTPLHLAVEMRRFDLLAALVALGADVNAPDGRGQTALRTAMLRGDLAAIDALRAAGAAAPPASGPPASIEDLRALAGSVGKGVPMITVADVRRSLAFYASLGFTEIGRYEADGVVNFGMVRFGGAEVMFSPGTPRGRDVSLWFYTDRVDDLYRALLSRQLAAVEAGEPDRGVAFEQDLEEMFYGARQFGVRDVDGYVLYFIQTKET